MDDVRAPFNTNLISFVGRFCTGKSTLINALAGKKLIPKNHRYTREEAYTRVQNTDNITYIEWSGRLFEEQSFKYPLEFLFNSDIVIYCMRCCSAFTLTDKLMIERLISLDYKSIIIVLTYFDVLLYNDEMNGTNDAEDAKRHYTKLLAKYTDLGEKNILFVSSLLGLNAKLNNMPALLNSSNLPLLEKRMKELISKY